MERGLSFADDTVDGVTRDTGIDRSQRPRRISVPLQTLCLALFDAVLVHTVNDVAAADNIDWHSLKQSLISALVRGKSSRAVEILSKRNEDVVFLQEVSMVFPDHATANPELNEQFHVLHPPPGDGSPFIKSLLSFFLFLCCG